jgi:lysyl oxidase
MNTFRTRWAVVVTATLVAAMTPSAYAATARLLPDLRQAPVGCQGGYRGDPVACTDWDVCMVRDASAPNGTCVTSGRIAGVRLRFTTAEDNVGDGPLLLYGQRASTATSSMAVRQAFQVAGDGAIPGSFETAQHPTAASAYYERAKMHQHWHLMGFARFELRASDGGVLVTDRKNGFCLGDRYTVADADRLPNAVRDDESPQGQLGRFLTQNMCKHHEPMALTVTEGISVGRGDDYRYNVDFQWLDLTGVPSGIYDVVSTVNADRTLVEKSYDNNMSSIAISVQWPGGASAAPSSINAPPTVSLIRSCPARAQCAVRP